MGHTQAIEFADQVAEGAISLEAALYWHLTANHYPPLPAALVPACVAAIDAVIAGDDEQRIPLDVAGVVWRGETTAPAYAIVEGFHLDAWLI